MPKSHPPYPPEFRRRMVELVRAGRTPGELASQFEPSAEAIRTRVEQADRDEGRREDGLMAEEREELGRLRRENKMLRLEREILKNSRARPRLLWDQKLPIREFLRKAAAWFARETGSIPPESSSS